MKEQDDVGKVQRIQTLIDRRQKMRTSLIQHCQKSPQEELFFYQLKPTENISKLELPVMTQTAYMLNECSLSIVDELQYLKYSDSTTTGDDYIDVPLIAMKKQKNPPYQSQNKPRNKKGMGGFLDLFL